jgi:hypothetical protein
MSLVNRVVGLAAVLGGILLFITGWRLDVGTPKLPGPGFFPLLIACAMAGLGIWLLLRPGLEERAPRAGSSGWGPLSVALLSVLAYALALKELGYLLSTFALLAIQLRWVERQSWRTSLITSVLAAASSLILFRVALKVPLPVGILPLPSGW